MKSARSRAALSAAIVLLAIVADQAIKVAVKLNMPLQGNIRIFDWFYIYFIENRGMAFGMELFGKIFLTLFRVVASGALVYYLSRLMRDRRYPTGYIVCLSFILAGALGNVIDCLFYGEIFTDSSGQVARLVPWGEGYGQFLQGKVVDMFYFPLVEFNWPHWMPWVGGEHFIFFSPIFNFADACISCGIIVLILFYAKWLNIGKEEKKRKEHEAEE